MSESTQQAAPPRRWLRFGIWTTVGVGLTLALFRFGGVEWSELVTTLSRLSPATFLSALGLHFCIYIARAERFRLLIPAAQRPPRTSLLAVTSAHNLAVYVLPAKTGEATLPLYLGRTCGVPAAQSIATLVVSRIFDLAALCACMGTVTLALCIGDHWEGPRALGFAIAVGLLAGAVLFLALAARGDLLVAPLQRIVRRVGLARTSLGARIEQHAESLEHALRAAGDGRLRTAALSLSFVVWLLIFAFYGVLAQGFGLPEGVGFLHASFGSSVAVLMNLLPINSFAGFGTQEAGWVLGFRWVGVPAEISLPGGVGVHLVQLFDTVLFGVLGHMLMGLAKRADGPRAG